VKLWRKLSPGLRYRNRKIPTRLCGRQEARAVQAHFVRYPRGNTRTEVLSGCPAGPYLPETEPDVFVSGGDAGIGRVAAGGDQGLSPPLQLGHHSGKPAQSFLRILQPALIVETAPGGIETHGIADRDGVKLRKNEAKLFDCAQSAGETIWLVDREALPEDFGGQ